MSQETTDQSTTALGRNLRPNFLEGAIDLHIHSAPDVMERIGSCVDIARVAADEGMSAIVLKDHNFPSFLKAVVTDQVVDGVNVYGGIALNTTAGGLSSRSARGAVLAGARVVMMPTDDTKRSTTLKELNIRQAARSLGEAFVELPIRDDSGQLTPGVEAVLAVVAEYPHVILSSGHLAGDDAVAVMERAHDLGIRKMMIEHPNNHPEWWTAENFQRLVARGVKFNLSYNCYNPVMGKRSFKEVVDFIQTWGYENCNLITDGGQPYNVMPALMLQVFGEMLLKEGIDLDHIFVMLKQNPAVLLDLEPAGL